MPESVLLDNDVVLKACAYKCHGETVAETTIAGTPPSILGIARYTMQTHLSRPGSIYDRDGAAAALEELLAYVGLLVPTQEEIDLAAELEERATSQALEFDTGESQLVAVMLSRGAPLLVTGDKRAIVALAGLDIDDTEGRVACFEQLIAKLLAYYPLTELRQGVCAEPKVDKAVTSCFACSASAVSLADVLAGLASYTNHLRGLTGTTLTARADLLPIIP